MRRASIMELARCNCALGIESAVCTQETAVTALTCKKLIKKHFPEHISHLMAQMSQLQKDHLIIVMIEVKTKST